MSSSSCGEQVGIYSITRVVLDKAKLSQLRVTHALAAVNQARGDGPVMRAAAAAALVGWRRKASWFCSGATAAQQLSSTAAQQFHPVLVPPTGIVPFQTFRTWPAFFPQFS